jgi:hypothetical protein
MFGAPCPCSSADLLTGWSFIMGLHGYAFLGLQLWTYNSLTAARGSASGTLAANKSSAVELGAALANGAPGRAILQRPLWDFEPGCVRENARGWQRQWQQRLHGQPVAAAPGLAPGPSSTPCSRKERRAASRALRLLVAQFSTSGSWCTRRGRPHAVQLRCGRARHVMRPEQPAPGAQGGRHACSSAAQAHACTGWPHTCRWQRKSGAVSSLGSALGSCGECNSTQPLVGVQCIPGTSASGHAADKLRPPAPAD